MEAVTPGLQSMRNRIILDVLGAVIEILSAVQVTGVLMVKDASACFAELAAVKLCWLPIALYESSLSRHEFVDELTAK
jgi:hypothetical protein